MGRKPKIEKSVTSIYAEIEEEFKRKLKKLPMGKLYYKRVMSTLDSTFKKFGRRYPVLDDYAIDAKIDKENGKLFTKLIFKKEIDGNNKQVR